MNAVSWGAVRQRADQAVLVLVLTALAAAVATAVSWYLLPVASDAAAAQVAAAAPERRVVQVHQAGELHGEPEAALRDFGARVAGLLPLPGARPWLGLVQDATYRDRLRDDRATSVPVAYRDGFCEHAQITGACPRAAGEAVLSRAVAGRLGLATGDRIALESAAAPGPVTITVTGLYERREDGAYWSDQEFRTRDGAEPAFTSVQTFRAGQLGRPEFAYDVAVPAGLLGGDGGFDFNAVLNAARPAFDAEQMAVVNPAGAVATAAGNARYDVAVDVFTLAGQVLVLALLALALAGRFTGRARRADAGLLLLRGGNRFQMLRLAAGQHLLPLAGGVLLGWPLGVLAARLLAGSRPLPAELGPALGWSAAAAAAVLFGGLLVLLVVDAFAQRGPVATMLRRVPLTRHDWRSGVVDALVVLFAAGAVYQGRAAGRDSGLGVVAPVLVALAVGVLLARLLRVAVDRAGAVAVRAGRLRAGLTAVQISRQPGADRVFALLVTAIAMVALRWRWAPRAC